MKTNKVISGLLTLAVVFSGGYAAHEIFVSGVRHDICNGGQLLGGYGSRTLPDYCK